MLSGLSYGQGSALKSDTLVTSVSNEINQSIKVYPNPFTSTINISGVTPDYCVLINSVGQETHFSYGRIPQDLPDGFYRIIIVWRNNFVSRKLIKQAGIKL